MITAKPLLPEINFGVDEIDNFHEVMDQLRTEGPVVPVTFLGDTVWCITSHSVLKEAFSDEEHFAMAVAYKVNAKPVMGITMESMEGEEHRINRGIISKYFLPREIRKIIEPLMEEEAKILLDVIEESYKNGQTKIDLMPTFIGPYPFKIITRFMGIPVDDDKKFMQWADALITYAWDPEGALKAKAEFTEYLTPIVRERIANPGDDMISILVRAEFEGNKLTEEEIISFCRLIFPAGSDSTYRGLGSLVYSVLADPALKEQALSSEEARNNMTEEMMRWEPPVATIPRRCGKSTVLAGVSIEKDDWILYGIAAASRDPEVVDNGDEFDPSRKWGVQLGFGYGVHFCVGSHFARAETETALRLLLERFPNLALNKDKPVKISGTIMRGPESLWVRL